MISNISNASTARDVTWPQRVTFLIRWRRSKSKKNNSSSSRAAKALKALEEEGQMRFLIGNADEGWPLFVGDFQVHSVTSKSKESVILN